MELSPSREDYLKAVLILGSQGKPVRIKELARLLAVKPPSAVSAIRQLAQAGLVRHEPYSCVELTDEGSRVAERIHNRNATLVEFLSRLGLDETTARRDACRVEHSLSPQALRQITKFLQFLEACPSGEPRCLAAFDHFSVTDSLPDSCPQLDEESVSKKDWQGCWCGTPMESKN